MDDIQKAQGHLNFANLVLSMCDGRVDSHLEPLKLSGGRCVRVSMDIFISEENYQACSNLAFNNLLKNSRGTMM